MILDPIVSKLLVGAGLLGASAGIVGALAVLRRRALVGDMLAHAALPGICLGFLVVGTRSAPALTLGALATGLLGVGLVAQIRRFTRTGEDAALAIVLSTFFGAGVVLLSIIQRNPSGEQAGLNQYLFGEIAALTRRDVDVLAVLLVCVVAVTVLLHKEVKTWLFDEGFGRTLGLPLLWLDWGVMGLVALVTVVALPICGVVLTAGMLIYPAAAARFWTGRFGALVALAGLIGAAVGAVGIVLASLAGSATGLLGTVLRGDHGSPPPPGPVIVLLGGLVFLASMLFAPRRGAVVRAVRMARLRLRMGSDHLLRSLFELVEPNLPATPDVVLSQATESLPESGMLERLVVRDAMARDWIRSTSPGRVQLTPAGLAAAADVTRKHRLWELYLLEHADIAADHVHRDADDLEHLLPAELVAGLERALAAEGKLPDSPDNLRVPTSPHALEAGDA
ncbi:Manganese transport system membrane protein MntB [Pirellulimonas nuda]|uniref:Manganese transport system membrane protein MntB n=1 Tax=Pirellulimonas nuda TaxID=2528009 RepID=A0A518DEN0_9BACT|nr:iron chelate uptake ABC transporter family permease subunit [Pirellulimonas nuda]QDU89934.1 Manganese transport system membrane protein MntB [Pirellulimonas nuda]